MNTIVKFIVYFLMITIGLVAMYSLLNAGNPNSFLRLVSPDSSGDVYIAVGSSLIVFVLGFFVFYSRDVEGFTQIIQLNGKKIRQWRSQGKSDGQIADSILKAMGSEGGYRHNMARRKLVAHLARFNG